MNTSPKTLDTNPTGRLLAATPAIFFVAVYLLLVFFLTSFFEQLFLDPLGGPTGLVLTLGALLYLVLLATYAWLWRHYGSRARSKSLRYRNSLSGRISLAFRIVSMVTSLPLGFLAFRVAVATTDLVIQGDLFHSIESGLQAIYRIYQDRSEALGLQVRSLLREPRNLEGDQLWTELKRRVPELVYLARYDGGERVRDWGETAYAPDPMTIQTEDDGWVPQLNQGGAVGVVWKESVSPAAFYLLVASIPTELGKARERLEKNREFLLQLRTYRGLFLALFFVIFIVLAIPLILLVGIASLVISDLLTRPLALLRQGLDRVAAGEYDTRLILDHPEEIRLLAEGFNRMVAELEDTKKRVVIGEKIEAWKDIAQQLAHEIRNPLTPIRLGMERLLKKYRENGKEAAPLIEGVAEKVLSEVDRLESLLTEFNDFARSPSPNPKPVDFPSFLEGFLQELKRRYAWVTWETSIQPEESFKADPWLLRRALEVLLVNAVEASPTPATITITARSVRADRRSWYRIEVRDYGTGIPPHHAKKIFQPYFTTKPQGSGLGLALVQKIAHEHGGEVWFESHPDGTSFFLQLPLEERTWPGS